MVLIRPVIVRNSMQKIITVDNHKSANVFLSSVLRNSKKSRQVYNYGLIHFQKFLSEKYPLYNVETILKSLTSNEINIYVILDEFVSYLSTLKISISSIQT